MILKPHPQAPIINHQSTTANTFFLNSQHTMPPFFFSNSTPNPFRIYSKFKPLLFPIMSHSTTTTTTKTRLRGVVFDMDGTLTVPVIDFQAMYKAVLGDDEYRRMKDDNPSGIDILHQIENFSPEKQRHAYATIADFEREALDRLQIMPGAAELCGLLDSKKIREFRPYKPDPAPLLHICAAWEIQPNEVIMVGDSLKDDVACGKRAGAFACLLDQTGRYDSPEYADVEFKPDFKVASLADVYSILEENFDLSP